MAINQIILILAIAGLSCGLQAPLHYTYKYHGSIGFGIPELGSQSSGTAIKADVEVFAEKYGDLVAIQLRNVKVVEALDDLHCDSRGDISDEYFHSIEDPKLAEAVEETFVANLFGNYDFAIAYEDHHFAWLPNVKKGVASILRNEILRGNVENQTEGTIAEALHNGNVINVFSVKEETMFGSCEVEYTVHPIPEPLAGTRSHELEKHILQDVQRSAPESSAYTSKTSKKSSKKYTSKTSRKSPSKTARRPSKYQRSNVPELEDDLWHVVRSVNFDNCDELAGFQIDQFSWKREDKNHYEWIRSRSSVAEYLFRGSPGNVRLEKAIIEGANTMMPFAFKTEALQARVKQTLQLIKVTEDTAPFPSLENTKESKTWMHEFFTPLPKPKHSNGHPWITYVPLSEKTGFFTTFGIDQFSPEKIKKSKEIVIDNIKLASLKLTDLDQETHGTNIGQITDILDATSFMIKSFMREDVLEVLDKIFEKDLHQHDILARKLAIDSVAASGAYTSYEALLEYFKAGKVPDLQVATVFMTLVSNAQTPTNLDKIIDYALSLDLKEKPFLVSTVLVNVGNFLGQMCTNPSSPETRYPGQIMSDYGCHKETIASKFVPYLKNLITEDTPDWEKMVAIKSLANLNSPASFVILSPVIEGHVKCSNAVRMKAINALEGWSLSRYRFLKTPVLDLLNDVYSDIAEKADVREAALMAATSWSPSTNFWFRLARLSWREPSRRFATYITHLIQTFATSGPSSNTDQAQAATHALKMARPIVPSFLYPYSCASHESSSTLDVNNFMHVDFRGGRTEDLLSSLNLFIMSGFGGFEIVDFELESVFTGLKSIFMEKETETTAEGMAARIAQDFYSKIQETVRAETIKGGAEAAPSANLFVRLYSHLQAVLPFNAETIKAFPLSNPTKIAELALQLTMGYDLVLGKYIRPVDLKSVIVTELGFPLFATVATPMLCTNVMYTTLNIENQPRTFKDIKDVKATSEVLSGLYFGMRSTLVSILPWSLNIVGVGVKSNLEVVLPINVHVEKTQKEEAGHQDILHVDLESHYKKKFYPLRGNNVPFVMKMGMFGGEPAFVEENQIYQVDPLTKKIHVPDTYTGLALDINWMSELPPPFNLMTLSHFLTKCQSEGSWLCTIQLTNQVRMWEYGLVFDPQASKTKKISFEFMMAKYGKPEAEEFTQFTQETGGTFEQYGQGSYDDYGQEQSFEFEQGFQEIGGVDEVETVPQISIGDSLTHRSQKMQEYFGGPVNSHSLSLKFTGKENRSFEFIHSTSSTKSGDKKLTKTQTSFSRSAIPDLDSKPASICVDFQSAAPVVSKLDTVDSVLNADLKEEVKVDVTLGCAGHPILALKGKHVMSDDWKEKYRKDLSHDCNFDKEDPLYTLLHTAAFDTISYDAKWEQVCDFKSYPITSKVTGLVNKVLDIILPQNSCDHSDSKHHLIVEAHRCPKRRTWFVDVQRGTKEVHYETLPHTKKLQKIFSITEQGDDFEEFVPVPHLSHFNTESNKCIVGIDTVRTFDGFSYEYNPSQCWTVAAKDCSQESGKVLLVRSSQGEQTVPDVRYIDVKKGLVIDYISNKVRVNGQVVDPIGESEVVKDDEGKPLVAIHKKNDYYMAKFSKDFYILAKEKIHVHIPSKLWGSTCGLCGNSDGEPEAELVGPHRCYYDDPKLFAASWTAGSDICNIYSLLELRDPVEKYQKTCTSIESYKNACPHFNDRCVEYKWKVISYEGKTCVTEGPVIRCRDNCDYHEYKETHIQAKCWPSSNAPEALVEALANNQEYIDLPESYESPFPLFNIYLSLPTVCKTY